MVEIHKRIGGPELLAQLFAPHHLARVFQQCGEDLKRLVLELKLNPVFTEFGRPKINFEDAEANLPRPFWQLYNLPGPGLTFKPQLEGEDFPLQIPSVPAGS